MKVIVHQEYLPGRYDLTSTVFDSLATAQERLSNIQFRDTTTPEGTRYWLGADDDCATHYLFEYDVIGPRQQQA